jgi:glycosyltransferase involved in cell wall biosynthesis
MKISCLLLTKNEEKTVQKTLQSVSNFDELVALDDSTDDTRKILLAHNVKIIEQSKDQFKTEKYAFHFGKAKNFLVAQAKHDHVFLIDGDETVHPNFYYWMKSHPNSLIHIEQVHMKNYSSYYRFGGEKARAGPKTRMVFDDVWNTNVIEKPDVNAPYCLLNWGYAALTNNNIASRSTLQQSQTIRDGKGNWWECFRKSDMNGMVAEFHKLKSYPLDKLPFIVPPASLFPNLGEPLRPLDYPQHLQLQPKPEFLEITLAIGCPVGCIKYCPQEVLTKKYVGNKGFTLDLFKRMLSTVPSSVDVYFSGWYEPFAHKGFLDYVEHAIKKGHRVHVDTTLYGATQQDIERLVSIPLEGVCLHLNDGKNVHFPVTAEYKENLFTVLQKIPKTECNIMNASFTSNRREEVARGILPKPRRLAFCHKLQVPQFVLLPNGDLQLCCMDMKLENRIGNLLIDDYASIRKRFLSEKQTPRLCHYCSFNVPWTRRILQALRRN